jgi:hypothetical protein
MWPPSPGSRIWDGTEETVTAVWQIDFWAHWPGPKLGHLGPGASGASGAQCPCPQPWRGGDWSAWPRHLLSPCHLQAAVTHVSRSLAPLIYVSPCPGIFSLKTGREENGRPDPEPHLAVGGAR